MRKESRICLTAYDWVPEFPRGKVRDIRLRWALEEAGLPYQVELITFGTQGDDKNLAIQPFGQVPVLSVDGVPIFESGAAVWRIAEASEALLPADPTERDRCLSWLFAALNTIEPPITMLAVLRFVEQGPENWNVADGAAAATVQPAGRQWIDMRLKQFSDTLGRTDHIVGNRFTVADLMLSAVFLTADRLELLDQHPNVKAYLDRHRARPAFCKAQKDQIDIIDANARKHQET